jgi:hypothetical protein
MIVYVVPGSLYVRAVLLTLEEKGAEYEMAAMAPGRAKTTTALIVPPVRPHPGLRRRAPGLLSVAETPCP